MSWRSHATAASGGGERHRCSQDVCLGRRLDDLGLSADIVHLRLAVADRRDGKGDLRHIAPDQVSKGASTGGGRRTYGLRALTRAQVGGTAIQLWLRATARTIRPTLMTRQRIQQRCWKARFRQ